MPDETFPDLETWRKTAREWLTQHAEPRPAGNSADRPRSEGSDSVAVFHNLSAEEEVAILRANQAWQQAKDDAGYAAIDWPPEWGGAGLPADYARVFAEEEAAFVTPPGAELFSVTVRLVAPAEARRGQLQRGLPPRRPHPRRPPPRRGRRRLAGGAHDPRLRAEPLGVVAPPARRLVGAAGRRRPALRPGR